MHICTLICTDIHMYISGHDVPKQESGEEGKNDRAALNRHPHGCDSTNGPDFELSCTEMFVLDAQKRPTKFSSTS